MKNKPANKWYDERGWALTLALLSLLAAYGVGSRALDTASWGQYFLAAGLLIYSINRLTRAAFPKKKKPEHA